MPVAATFDFRTEEGFSLAQRGETAGKDDVRMLADLLVGKRGPGALWPTG